MSQCFRTISCKLPPFIGTKKQVSQMSRQLPKHIKCSTFLEEFLGSRNVLNSQTLRDVSNEIVLPYLAFKNKIVSSLDIPRENLIALRENVRKDMRTARYNDVRRHHLLEEKPIDLLLQENLRNRQKYSKNFTKKQQTENVIFYEKSSSKFNDYSCKIIPPNIENSGIVFMTDDVKPQIENEKNVSNIGGKPSKEQLEFIYEKLKKDLPQLFVRTFDYRIYHKDFVFENNIRGTRTIGIFPYVRQISLLRTVGHLRFAYVKLDILKITIHPEDDSVKVRWRIAGLPGFKVFLMFWKFNVFKLSESIKHQEAWYDGFSTFYIGADGLISKHMADKMMPDQDSEKEKKKEPSPVAAKLTLFSNFKKIELFPQISFSNIGKFLSHSGRKWTLFEKIAFKMK
ncbi:uncharacterized protein LOC122507857 [Leptopilina heterotoma]|uniref:uncharacterized protein LOC122507857 n=1 Tax=Leptopilina heterotoma TaxID=63436 RepID=UPI001CA96124|nr:uncharacterized protein LOC122507857 [Leptopilina heterotoma]